MPICSVIIPTYKRGDKLRRTLDALSRQSVMNFEVIIAVDGPRDSSYSYLEAMLRTFAANQIVEHTRAGRGGNRNLGASKSQSDILIFLDDDMRPLADCIKSHLDHHARFPGSILGGNAPEDPSLVRSDFQAYKTHLSHFWARETAWGPSDEPLGKDQVFLAASHFSIRREVFQSLGGFNSSLSDCEDFDFAARAFLKGTKIYFRRDLIAWHDDIANCRSYIERKRQWAKARKALFKDNKTLLHEFPNQYPREPAALKKVFFRLLAQDCIVRAIDAERSILLIPKPIRFKLYEYVVAALGNYFTDVPLSDQ